MLRSFFPILDWLPNYKKTHFSGDLFAGLTVGVMLIPQGMAYAMLAGLPPIFGLYAAFVPQIIYAFTGTSRQLAVGPVAMDSLLVAAGLGALAISKIEDYISMAVFLAFFMGAIQLLLGILRMGFLVQLLSKPVINGFTSAAAIIIGMSQFKHLLGVQVPSNNRLHVLLIDIFGQLDNTNVYALGSGILSMIIIWGFKKWIPKFPGILVAVVLSILVVYWTRWDLNGLRIVGDVPEGLPAISLPSITMENIQTLLPTALTLALVAFLEAVSVAKAIQEQHKDYEINANQELRALGLSNIVGSFFQSYPTTGGFSRTALNHFAGAKTGLSFLISAAVVATTLLFLTPLFYYMPLTTLAALVIVAVSSLIDLKYPLVLLKTRMDEFLLLNFTFLTTLFVGITQGILFGVALSLVLLIFRISNPHFAFLARIKGSSIFKNIERFPSEVEDRDDLIIIRFDAPLFFGNRDFFKKIILEAASKKQQTLKAIILNAESINYIDSSALDTLLEMVRVCKSNNTRFIIAGAIGPARDVLLKKKVRKTIGSKNFFVSIALAVAAFDGQPLDESLNKSISHQKNQ
ncbi:MAG: sulfate permease [Bacteroidetes bacterium]|nr:sulfate permease [Bacteroidota bacterium]MDA1345156.1 sulfate permease [Bacteroidota bacterium]